MLLAQTAFRFLGPAHLLVLVLTVAGGPALSILARKVTSANLTRGIAILLAGLLLANEAWHICYGLATVGLGEFLRSFLPLHICGAAVYLTALALLTRNQIAYETAYFWALAGTVQAVITPELAAGFGSYDFLQYFIRHSGVITGVLFATWAMRMRPSRRSLVRTIIISNLFAAAVAGVNVLLDANYMFLCRPPDAPSPFFTRGISSLAT